MFKIGEFARLSQVSVKTLHHYDEIGLFKPVWIDPHTGYRYYSMDQLARLKQILTLKDFGLSLDQITSVLASRASPDDLHELLRARQSELLQRIRDDQRRLAQIDAFLGGVAPAHQPIGYDIRTHSVAPLTVASIRTRIPPGALHQLHGELRAALHRRGIGTPHAPLTLLYPDDSSEGWQDVEAALPIDEPFDATERVRVRTLPAVETMAEITHIGSYQTLYRAYESLAAWVETNGYRSLSPWREVYLRDGSTTPLPESYVTTIQIPVEPW